MIYAYISTLSMLKNSLKLLKKGTNNVEHDENQYLALILDILNEGSLECGRNGDVKMIYGSAMHFSLDNNVIPFITTKKLAWKTCLRELLWFIKGNTDNNILQNQNVHIWDGNGSRDFLDSRGLNYLREGDLGPIYGHQWRFFNAPYDTCDTDYTGKGIDQLDYIIKSLKDTNKRTSRRLVMSAWNPSQLNEMALPPCHILCQFNVENGIELSCSLYQRSGDVALGVPFNIASYSFLTHILAKHCGLIAKDFYYYLGNCHIYDDHIDGMHEQLERLPYDFPTLSIIQTCNDINEYTEDMFKINDYNFHETIKLKMRK